MTDPRDLLNPSDPRKDPAWGGGSGRPSREAEIVDQPPDPEDGVCVIPPATGGAVLIRGIGGRRLDKQRSAAMWIATVLLEPNIRSREVQVVTAGPSHRHWLYEQVARVLASQGCAVDVDTARRRIEAPLSGNVAFFLDAEDRLVSASQVYEIPT